MSGARPLLRCDPASVLPLCIRCGAVMLHQYICRRCREELATVEAFRAELATAGARAVAWREGLFVDGAEETLP